MQRKVISGVRSYDILRYIYEYICNMMELRPLGQYFKTLERFTSPEHQESCLLNRSKCGARRKVAPDLPVWREAINLSSENNVLRSILKTVSEPAYFVAS
jgi:hypothetical protein